MRKKLLFFHVSRITHTYNGIHGDFMDRNLAIEVVRVTEAAAPASARLMGRGDEKAADQAAVDAMRKALNSIRMCGTVVIGEGERDEAPMLYIGEKVGCGNGGSGVIAIAQNGNFLHAPDTYMEKIAVGPGAKGAIDLNRTSTENLRNIADSKGVNIEDLTVIILNRPRHKDLIDEVRRTGARIKLIQDGDVSAAIATAKEGSGVDVLMGIGGAPEGVIAAAALRCVGGDMQGRLKPRNNEEIERAKRMGIKDINKIYSIEQLAKGDVMFAATGVTEGDFLRGVRFFGGGAETHSVVMRSKTRTIRYITATHHFEHKPNY